MNKQSILDHLKKAEKDLPLSERERVMLEQKRWSDRAGHAMQMVNEIRHKLKEWETVTRYTAALETIASHAAENSLLLAQLDALSDVMKGAQSRADMLALQLQNWSAPIDPRANKYYAVRTDLLLAGEHMQYLDGLTFGNRPENFDQMYAAARENFVRLNKEIAQFDDIATQLEAEHKLKLASKAE